MATSSILTNFVVDNEESIKIIVKAFEEAEKRDSTENEKEEEYPVASSETMHKFLDGKKIV